MVIQAFRFTLADSDETFDEILKPCLVRMLTTMLNDLNLENRRLALGALNSATHNKRDILLPHLAHLLPLVMRESKLKPELVRDVAMGPFRHKVDDGLEVRKVQPTVIPSRLGAVANVAKSAYETLYSLMDIAYSMMIPSELFERVILGLEDEHEIKVLCSLMLTKLIVLDPEETVRRLDSIAERFRSVLAVKPKENAVKQEVEKVMEATKGVLKVTVHLHNAFPAASDSVTGHQGQLWKAYWDWVGKDFKSPLLAMQQEVQNQAG
jgi:cullin-associated NEDD8-dissociated protein 1